MTQKRHFLNFKVVLQPTVHDSAIFSPFMTTKEWSDTVLCNSGDIMLHKNPNQGSALFLGLPETTFIGPIMSPTIGLCDTISGHSIRERLHIKDYLHYAAVIYFTGRDAWINTNSDRDR